jgi:hypothetical protein
MRKVPGVQLVDIAVLDAKGHTLSDITKSLKVSTQAINERINHDCERYGEIKTSYLRGIAFQRGINRCKNEKSPDDCHLEALIQSTLTKGV